MLKRNQTGLGITELVVVAGIASLVALAFSGMLVNSMKGQRGVQVKSSLQEFQGLVTLTLANRTSCQRALSGQPVNGSPVRVKQVDNPTRIWFESGTSMVTDGFTIDSVTLAPQPNRPNLALLQIEARATNSKAVLGSAKFPLIRIPLYVELSGSQVQRCGAEGAGGGGGGTPDYHCELKGGSMVDLGGTGVAQCFLPNQMSGLVVRVLNLSTATPPLIDGAKSCQPPDNIPQARDKSAAYCKSPNPPAIPCCRRGFKRVRTGTTYLIDAVKKEVEQTFTCTFVEPNFCWEAGLNGCDCN